ncbi:MAG TPA: DoxX family protein [Bacteroidota bacterium]|nr:DoxX family protein [Bacteroidota bacterium]
MGTVSTDVAKLLLRLTVGGLMIFHGISKIAHGISWLGPAVTGAGLPEFIQYGVYLGEIVGPVLLILGYHTRVGALLVIADMVFALFIAHRHQIFSLNAGGGWAIELPAFFLLAGVVVLLLGGGRFSVGGSAEKF